MLEGYGVEVIKLPANKEGVIDIIALKDALNERTVVVSVMHVNNEVGTIEPLREIKFMIDEFRKKQRYACTMAPRVSTLPYRCRAIFPVFIL